MIFPKIIHLGYYIYLLFIFRLSVTVTRYVHLIDCL